MEKQNGHKKRSDAPRKEIDKKGTKTKDKNKELMTARELRELMGVNRDTYKRKNGAVQRR